MKRLSIMPAAKQVKLLLVGMFLLTSSFAIASSETECETVSMKFKIKQVETLDGTKLQSEDYNNKTGGVILDFPVARRIYRGHLSIIRHCKSEYGLQMKETKIPTNAELDLYGANLRIGTLGYMMVNEEMTFHGFSGNKLTDVLKSMFVGGKLAATLVVLAGFNPNFDVMVNKSGVIIADTENWFGLVGLAGGITLSSSVMQFYPDFTQIAEDVEL